MRFPIVVVSVFFATLSLCSHLLAATTCKVDFRPILFGGYNPLADFAPVNSTGSVDVSCAIDALPLSTTVPYQIGISAGSSGSFNARRMMRASDFLSYNISAYSVMSPIWGDGTGGSLQPGSISGFTALNSNRTNFHTVYAVIYPRQIGKALGEYTDVLNVTVSF